MLHDGKILENLSNTHRTQFNPTPQDSYFITALEETINKDEIGPWLQRPNKAFGNLKPLAVIKRGEHDRIWQMIFELRSGVAF